MDRTAMGNDDSGFYVRWKPVALALTGLLVLFAIFAIAYSVTNEHRDALARATFAIALVLFMIQLMVAILQMRIASETDRVIALLDSRVTLVGEKVDELSLRQASSDDPDLEGDTTAGTEWLRPEPTTLRGRYASFLESQGWHIGPPPSEAPEYAVKATRDDRELLIISTERGRRSDEALRKVLDRARSMAAGRPASTPVVVIGQELEDPLAAIPDEYAEVAVVSAFNPTIP